MKFEHKHPGADATQRFEFEYSHVTKSPKLGQCRWCGSFTKWFDVLFQSHACSEECLSVMWKKYRADQEAKSTYDNFELHFDKIKQELQIAEEARGATKDILVVVHDQLEYFKVCVDSLKATTRQCHLYIWDNASQPETENYIQRLMLDSDPSSGWQVSTLRSETNTGFIYPNNELAALGDSEYIVLLNSDTKVFEGWDKLMTGYLDKYPETAQVGYWGGHLGADGRGFGGDYGHNVDYIPGWCFCISRKTYNEFGLFNPALQFAYCEDADLSLRLLEAGKRIFSLHAPLVHHYQNKTIVAVEKEGAVDVRATFEHNHEYLKQRWKHYLENDRVMLRRERNEPCRS